MHNSECYKYATRGNHSVTDVQDYIKELPQGRVVEQQNPAQITQYRSLVDLVTTIEDAYEGSHRRNAAGKHFKPYRWLDKVFPLARDCAARRGLVVPDAKFPEVIRAVQKSLDAQVQGNWDDAERGGVLQADVE